MAFLRSRGFTPPGLPKPAKKSRSRRRISDQAAPPYSVLDTFSEILIAFILVCSPWFFGTTEPWSIWTINMAAYLLGGLWVAKMIIRKITGTTPIRWGEEWKRRGRSPRSGGESEEGEPLFDLTKPPQASRIVRVLTILLAVLTVFVLTFTLTSAINARATYLGWQLFNYHDNYIPWLPHTYDKLRTWSAFWMYLGWACFFWSTRDWLLEKAPSDLKEKVRRRHARHSRHPAFEPLSVADGPTLSHSANPLPVRLRRILWVICINGGLVALEGILQRLDRTPKLLWIRESWWHDFMSCFGPYSYRANAAQYFNLIWPICVGLWLCLGRARRTARIPGQNESGSEMLLIPLALITAIAPVLTASRGGAMIAIGTGLLVILGTVIAGKWSWKFKFALAIGLITMMIFSAFVGWRQLGPRFHEMFQRDDITGRGEIYTNAVKIARDFPIYGTGPATFGTMYQLYREPKQTWHAMAHNDYLETRITFGWVGFGAILLMLALTLIKPLFPTGIQLPRELFITIGITLLGVFLHARFDLPFQVGSIVLLVLFYLAVLSVSYNHSIT